MLIINQKYIQQIKNNENIVQFYNEVKENFLNEISYYDKPVIFRILF